MKTRIKEIRYGDGKVIYKAQSMSGFKDALRDLYDEFKKNPLILIIILPIIITVYPIMIFTWDESKYESLSEAQQHIDDIYRNIKINEEKKEKAKLAKKVVSKTYIKYP